MVAHEMLQVHAAAPADTDDPHPPRVPPAQPLPESDGVTVPAADVTAVITGEELQAASADEAQDIEIRAHLDMRRLTRTPNQVLEADPGFQAAFTQATTRLALLYAQPPMRSMRVRTPLSELCLLYIAIDPSQVGIVRSWYGHRVWFEACKDPLPGYLC